MRPVALDSFRPQVKGQSIEINPIHHDFSACYFTGWRNDNESARCGETSVRCDASARQLAVPHLSAVYGRFGQLTVPDLSAMYGAFQAAGAAPRQSVGRQFELRQRKGVGRETGPC